MAPDWLWISWVAPAPRFAHFNVLQPRPATNLNILVIDQAAPSFFVSVAPRLLVHSSSTPLALFIYERFLEGLRTSRSWINAPSANPLMTRAMRIPCGSKFAPHISPATKSSHEYKNRNTRRGFLDRVAVSLKVVWLTGDRERDHRGSIGLRRGARTAVGGA
jgi:hypothetical protein